MEIAKLLNFRHGSLLSKYLGAPLIDSALKHSSWKDLLAKLELYLSQWTLLTLNLVGHLVLIKYVVQAMLLYLFLFITSTSDQFCQGKTWQYPRKIMDIATSKCFFFRGNNSIAIETTPNLR